MMLAYHSLLVTAGLEAKTRLAHFPPRSGRQQKAGPSAFWPDMPPALFGAVTIAPLSPRVRTSHPQPIAGRLVRKPAMSRPKIGTHHVSESEFI